MLRQALKEAGELPDRSTAGDLSRFKRRVANNPNIELPEKRLNRWQQGEHSGEVKGTQRYGDMNEVGRGGFDKEERMARKREAGVQADDDSKPAW
jgi:hypothetical protein